MALYKNGKRNLVGESNPSANVVAGMLLLTCVILCKYFRFLGSFRVTCINM